MTRRLCFVAPVLLLALASAAHAQLRPVPEDQGADGLGLALRHLTTSGSVLYVTAHPDDENNGVLVALNRGRGLDTALLTLTRGDGGQNEIGPELFEALGVLRTEELAALHRFDGTEQYFTTAVDFGYSFSAEEVLAKWGPDQTISDYVRLIRTIRPDVMTVQSPDYYGDGAQHPVSGTIAI